MSSVRQELDFLNSIYMKILLQKSTLNKGKRNYVDLSNSRYILQGSRSPCLIKAFLSKRSEVPGERLISTPMYNRLHICISSLTSECICFSSKNEKGVERNPSVAISIKTDKAQALVKTSR